jgi:diketogulonate reductase-like aldo/keto reductase
MISRFIPSSGESIPVIGLGTWQTFDVNPGRPNDSLLQVLTVFHQAGGRLIDSSPMYGQAEAAVGALTHALRKADDCFYATKVWISGKEEGIWQMESSFRRMRRSVIDLMQIHNLVDWKTHIETLRKWKDQGRIRYIGITHYTDDSHAALEQIITSVPIDFVQFNYSIFSRHAEHRLLPTAADHGVATLINRPLGEGRVFERVKGKPLPSWAKEYGIDNWSTFFLKFIVSHPAVTCVIPATSNPAHMVENVAAGSGAMPDHIMRRKMVDAVNAL